MPVMVEGLLATCQSCGLTFLARGLIGGTLNAHIKNIGTNCVQCGGRAVLHDGVYTIRNNETVNIAGSEITKESFAKLRDLYTKHKSAAQEEKFSATELLAEIAGVSPELAEKLRRTKGMNVAVALLALFWLINSVKLDIKIDLNRLIDQAFSLVEKSSSPSNILLDPPPFPTNELPPTKMVGQGRGEPSRQARRRQASQERKRRKRGATSALKFQ